MNSAAPLPRWRRITVWVLIILAGLIGLVSALTVWAKRQALDTDKWVATSSQLLENDEIRGALSLYLVDQLYTNVDVAAELQARLPPEVKPLAAPIAGGLRELSVRAADNLLSRPGVQTLWEEANRRAHEAFIRIVDDEGQFLQTGEGEVVLDLSPIVQQLADRVGLTEQQVEERLGPDAGRIVIMKADQLGTVQTAVELIRKLSVWLAIAVFVLFALAVYLAKGRRRETLRAVGITFVVVGALLLVTPSPHGELDRRHARERRVDTAVGVERVVHRHRPAGRHRLDRDRLRRDPHRRGCACGADRARRFGCVSGSRRASATIPGSSTRSWACCTCSSSPGARRPPSGSRGRSSSSPP